MADYNQFPDESRIYADFRQIDIPVYSGTPVFEDLPLLPDYLVDGGDSSNSYNDIDGGSASTNYTTFNGGTSG